MNFIDKVRIFLTAGDGGNGCNSFLREKFRPDGGPDGGDGGQGGDIYLEASSRLTTLLDCARRPHVTATAGGHGQGDDKTGDCGQELVIHVPVGTVVYKKGVMQADLCREGQRFLAAHGGRGGRGNLSFKTRFNTAPRLCEKGEPGEQVTLELELKLIADVGFLGFPNAGKSSLLSRISAARPKIADYPFTTLSPNLGVALHKRISFVAADIPGLIEGAHAGKGLGAEFLRHIERTRILVHLVDPVGYGKVGAVDGVKVIENELKKFSAKLFQKPRILIANKMDLPEAADVLKKIQARYRSRKVLGISTVTGEGVEELLDRIILELSKAKPAADFTVPAKSVTAMMETGFEARSLGGGVFLLTGRYVERIAAMLQSDLPEAVERFQRALKHIGVDKALRRAGIKDGNEVRCNKLRFDWYDQPLKQLPRLRRRRRLRIGVGI